MTFMPMRLCARALPVAVVALVAASPAFAQVRALFEDVGKTDWKEAELKLPAYPLDANLIPLAVSPFATARFFIDEKSLSLGDDGVVRYTLIVRASGGAQNVSYEGIRCETAERKLYAFARPDGEWTRSRNDTWQQIEEKNYNRQHAVLAKDFFCPPGAVRPGLGQIVEALRREGGVR
ncbi:CNP1-like family protein [Zoogloea sp.]|uniref:CNP1-like family protein n=1 Tax=Zoogloea sp. TaxID=49181 RepID=UPI0035B05501